MRIRFRFRFHTLLAAVTICAILVGWYATNHAAYTVEQRLLDQLKPQHGFLNVSSHSASCAFGQMGFISCEPTTVVDRVFSVVNPPLFERVTAVTLASPQFDDSALEIVSQFPNLKKLDCRDTSATAAGVARLRQARPNVTVLFEVVVQHEPSNILFANDPNDPFSL